MKHYSNLGEYSWSSAVILKPGVVTLLFVTEILQCVRFIKMKQINLFSILANKSIFFALCVGNKKSELKGVTALKRLSTLRQTAHNQEVVSSNPGTVYWTDVITTIKVDKWSTPKKKK